MEKIYSLSVITNKDIVAISHLINDISEKNSVDKLLIFLFSTESVDLTYNIILMETLNQIVKEKITEYTLVVKGTSLHKVKIQKLLNHKLNSVIIEIDEMNSKCGFNFSILIDNIVDLIGYGLKIQVTIELSKENYSIVKDLLKEFVLLDLNEKISIQIIPPKSNEIIKSTSYFFDIYQYLFSNKFNVYKWNDDYSITSKYYFSVDYFGNIFSKYNFKENAKLQTHQINLGLDKPCYNISMNSKCLSCRYVGNCKYSILKNNLINKGQCALYGMNSMIDNEYVLTKYKNNRFISRKNSMKIKI